METVGICRFCDIVLGEYRYNDVDEPFAINDDFFAVASIGAFIEGWTLVISKSHQLSMSNNYNNPLFRDFLEYLIPPLVHQYGPLIAFEHGAKTEDSITACGTAHAHLHLVPFGGSLLPNLQNSDMKWVKCSASEIISKSGEEEYLFYSELRTQETWQNLPGYLHVLEKPISQFFRHLIAERIGRTEIFDYKLFPLFDISKQTRSVLINSFV